MSSSGTDLQNSQMYSCAIFSNEGWLTPRAVRLMRSLSAAISVTDANTDVMIASLTAFRPNGPIVPACSALPSACVSHPRPSKPRQAQHTPQPTVAAKRGDHRESRLSSRAAQPAIEVVQVHEVVPGHRRDANTHAA